MKKHEAIGINKHMSVEPQLDGRWRVIEKSTGKVLCRDVSYEAAKEFAAMWDN